ncbi:MAG TPA: L-lactate dehydrogenase [Pyrinomonadaceae bacterium]|nr:L-lactate dehydrogenase [Pyrinomonadaceae bacterium]
MPAKQNRVAIIGCGHVGATSAYALLMNGFVEELILIDKDCDKLLGEVMDLQHAVPLAHQALIRQGNFEDAANADIAVIAAGVSTYPGETRLDLLSRNIAVIREIIGKLMRSKFDGIILMITNPVDILAQVAQEESGLPASRVIGSGTVLDTARLRAMLGDKLQIEGRSIHAYIIGEHGESEVATWCAARIGGAPLVDFCTPDCPDFDKMLEAVRNSAPEIVRRKGYTSFAVGTCVNRICEAILRDERTILPVSAMTGGQYGISGVYLSLPCVVGRGGIEKIVELPLSDDEKRDLLKSAAILKTTYETLKIEEQTAVANVI